MLSVRLRGTSKLPQDLTFPFGTKRGFFLRWKKAFCVKPAHLFWKCWTASQRLNAKGHKMSPSLENLLHSFKTDDSVHRPTRQFHLQPFFHCLEKPTLQTAVIWTIFFCVCQSLLYKPRYRTILPVSCQAFFSNRGTCVMYSLALPLPYSLPA